jgi:hypothetical protein
VYSLEMYDTAQNDWADWQDLVDDLIDESANK